LTFGSLLNICCILLKNLFDSSKKPHNLAVAAPKPIGGPDSMELYGAKPLNRSSSSVVIERG